MSDYTPNNLCVYLAAFTGGIAGLAAAGKYLGDARQSDYTYPAEQADALAQAIDEAWGAGSYTNADLQQLQSATFGVWQDRSPLTSSVSTESGSYAGLATAIVALVRAGTAQIVAEGIDPNGCGGGVTPINSPFTEVAHTATPIETSAWKFAADTTNGPVNLVLTGTPAANQLLIVAPIGTASNPVNITAPAGMTIWNPSTGAFAASATMTGGPGNPAQWQLDTPNNRFIQIV